MEAPGGVSGVPNGGGPIDQLGPADVVGDWRLERMLARAPGHGVFEARHASGGPGPPSVRLELSEPPSTAERTDETAMEAQRWQAALAVHHPHVAHLLAAFEVPD